ncbi:MAG: WG repeat-containing protein [bacterium]
MKTSRLRHGFTVIFLLLMTIPLLGTSTRPSEPCKKQEGWGYCSGSELVTPAQFDKTKHGGSVDHVAPVKKNGKWGFINVKKSGRNRVHYLVEPKFDDVRTFSKGLAAVKAKAKWGFINRNGNWQIQPRFDNVIKFHVKEQTPVQLNGKWGHVTRQGKLMYKPTFNEVKNFEKGLAPAKSEEKWGYINKKGAWKINPRFNNPGSFSITKDGSCARVLFRSEKVNRKGEILSEHQVREQCTFHKHIKDNYLDTG